MQVIDVNRGQLATTTHPRLVFRYYYPNPNRKVEGRVTEMHSANQHTPPLSYLNCARDLALAPSPTPFPGCSLRI